MERVSEQITNYTGSRTMTRSQKIKKMKKSTENFQEHCRAKTQTVEVTKKIEIIDDMLSGGKLLARIECISLDTAVQ